LINVSGVITDIGHAWTAGQRVNVTNSSSSFIWRLKTVDYHAKLPISYDAWAAGEPNNVNGDQFCVVMWQNTGYLWHDGDCGVYVNSVCEIDIA